MSCSNERTWTTKPGSTRADSNVGGYWITWTPMPSWPAPWHNAWVMEAGKKRNLEAGTKRACLDACESHYAKSLAVPACDNVRPVEKTSQKIGVDSVDSCVVSR